MTFKHINERVNDIKEIDGDYELAHTKEDALYLDFIQYVARGGSADLIEKARAVLKTQTFNFARYCA